MKTSVKLKVTPTLALHHAISGRNGLSRWEAETPYGKRVLLLQAYKGRLYLYGQMIEHPRDGTPFLLMRFEAPVGEIVRTFGELSPASK